METKFDRIPVWKSTIQLGIPQAIPRHRKAKDRRSYCYFEWLFPDIPVFFNGMNQCGTIFIFR